MLLKLKYFPTNESIDFLELRPLENTIKIKLIQIKNVKLVFKFQFSDFSSCFYHLSTNYSFLFNRGGFGGEKVKSKSETQKQNQIFQFLLRDGFGGNKSNFESRPRFSI